MPRRYYSEILEKGIRGEEGWLLLKSGVFGYTSNVVQENLQCKLLLTYELHLHLV